MLFYGHTLEELDALRDEFDLIVEKCLYQACAKASKGVDRTLVAAAVDVESSVLNDWASLVDDVMLGHVAATYDGASLSILMQLADNVDLPPGDGLPLVSDPFAVEHLTQAKNRLKNIGNDVWKNVRAELEKGQALGESIDELAHRVQAAAEVSLPRARTIARTEINSASNAGAYNQVAFLGMTGTQEWLATPDARTRETHHHADGQKIALNESFSVGGYSLKYPGDHNAPASEIVNCRCTVAYDIDPEQDVSVTCTGITAAATNAATSYCAVPGAGAPSLVPDQSKIDKLTAQQRKDIFAIFQSPSSISPAYGGAKIHKVLGEAVQNIHASGIPEFADLSHADVLAVVDSQYKGGKYTFKEKYQEWLVKKYGATPAPTHVPTSHVDLTTPGPTPPAPPPAVAPTPPPVVAPTPATTVTVPKTNKGYTPLKYLSGDISAIPDAIKNATYAEFKKNKVTAIWSGNKIYESASKVKDVLASKGIHLNDHEIFAILDEQAAKNNASVGFVDKMLKWEQSGPGKKIVGDLPAGVSYDPGPGLHVPSAPATSAAHIPTPPPPPTPPPVVPPPPPPVAAGKVLETFGQAKKHADSVPNGVPFAKAKTVSGVDLRLVKNSDGQIVYEYFDDYGTWTPVSPAFTKSQFTKYEWVTIDTSVPIPPPTPPTPTLAVGAKFKTYDDAVKHAMAVPNGKPFATAQDIYGSKYRLIKNADGDIIIEMHISSTGTWQSFPVTSTKKYMSDHTWTVVDDVVSVGGPTPSVPSVVVSVPADFKKKLLTQLNNKGPLLGKSGPYVYEKIQEIKIWAKKNGHDLSDLDLLRILDAEKATSLGVDNGHLYEKKIVDWLKQPGNAKKAESIAKKVEFGTPAPTPSATPSTPSAASSAQVYATDLGDLSLSDIRANISTTDTSFPVFNLRQATDLQNEMAAVHGQWTPAQRASLRFYTSNNYVPMNGCLRFGQPVSKSMGNHIKNAQAGMRPSTRSLVLHRGTGENQFGGMPVDKTLIGKTLTDQGFMSTSFGGRAAFNKPIILEIECPTGTPMAFVKYISHYESENEILLAAGTKYQVVDVFQDGSKKVVKVRVIP